MPTPDKVKSKRGTWTEFQVMYEKVSDQTTRLFYVTADSVETAITEFRQSHISEEILSVVKL